MSSSSGEEMGTPIDGEAKDRVEVFLRLKPLANNEVTIANVVDDKVIIIDPQPAFQLGQRQFATQKPIRYTFEKIFRDSTKQPELFEHVALPMIEDVLCGKPGLCFMYGVSGSGKTYTMSGYPDDAGILPRCLDVLFNSIPMNLKSMKYLFKPDNLNGYDVRSEADAMSERQNEMLKGNSQSLGRGVSAKKQRNEFHGWMRRERDSTRVRTDIPEYSKVAVFVQYVEIYNNYVYDLLEEESASVQARAKGPQSRVVREDASKCMYVFGATEIEVENADEAIEVWMKGQKRKRVANTLMNSESSRSHSVFIIKVVQAPVNDKSGEVVQKKEFTTVTQFNLVDLAGCERAHKTAAKGDRLKEASSINNSLMSLRQCLDMLRENQISGTNKMVPYRDSKLTHLFKSFFEGKGKIRVVVCVNPRADDCAEIIDVMKFSETAQEIEVQRVQAKQVQQYTESSSPSESLDEMIVDTPEVVSIPGCLSHHCHSEADTLAILKLVKDGVKETEHLKNSFHQHMFAFRQGVRDTDEALRYFKDRASAREKELKQKTKLLQDLTNKISAEAREKDSLKEKLMEHEAKSETAMKRCATLEDQLRRAKESEKRARKEMEVKWSKEKEVLMSKMSREISEQKQEALRKGAQLAKANLLKDIINVDEFKSLDPPSVSTATPSTRARTPRKPQSLKQRTQTFHTIETPSRRAATKVVSTSSEPDLSEAEAACPAKTVVLRRRSKSNDARWIEHSEGFASDTIVQPKLSKRKSVTKLSSKDLEHADKYALVTSNLDSKLQVVKGEVLASPSGGSAVVFTGIETVTETDAGTTKRRERGGGDSSASRGPLETMKRCAVAIEGHPYMKNVIHRGKNEKYV